MVRIFSHYVSARLVVLIVAETLLLTLVVYAGFSFDNWRTGTMLGSVPAAVPPEATAYALGMLVVMNSFGLYQQDRWNDVYSVLGRLLATVLVGVAIMVVVTWTFSSI